MRVALLCPYSLSRPGGVQGQVAGLGLALAAAGHEVTVLAPSDGPLAVAGVGGATDPVRFVDLGRTVGVPANGSVAPLALAPAASVRAVRAVRRGGFDVLHLHEPLAPGPGLACLVATSLPKVGTFHRAGASTAYRVLGPAARRAAARLAVRCAVSDEARATAEQALGGSCEVVGNGIDLDRFARAVPAPVEGPTVLFVGRHEPRKGLGVLLEALARLAPADRPVAWVAGQGPETEALRRRFPPSPRLAWLGRLGDAELAARLAGAHVLCAPSLGGESFGVVLLEAMAARTAVVASALPGYAAVVGRHGVLVPPGDVGALAEALGVAAAEAAASSGRSSPVALDEARAHAAHWAMERVAERYARIYRRVGGPGPG